MRRDQGPDELNPTLCAALRRLLEMPVCFTYAPIIIIASFTAQISSALTVSSLESGISGPKDLPKAEVARIEPLLCVPPGELAGILRCAGRCP
jgi:hypothetical protein